MMAEFSLDDAVLSKDQAAGDIVLDDIIDPLPRGAALQRFVGFLRHQEAELADVGANRLAFLPRPANQVAAPFEPVNEAVGFQALQGAPYRITRGLENLGNAALDQHQSARQP